MSTLGRTENHPEIAAQAQTRRQVHALALACDSRQRARDPSWPWGGTSIRCKLQCGGQGVAKCSEAELLLRRRWLLRAWAESRRLRPGDEP